MGIAVELWCTNGLFTILYLLDVNLELDCILIQIPLMILLIGNDLMFIPTCVDRFIHIGFPFSYKYTITTIAITATIITLWMVAILVTTFIFINSDTYK